MKVSLYRLTYLHNCVYTRDMTTTTALAPIIKTQFARRVTRGGLTRSPECWGAQTADGTWDLTREESSGTPWIVIHRETGIAVNMCGTLRACRAYVAAGHAGADLARLQAHDRGEHKAERDVRCGRC